MSVAVVSNAVEKISNLLIEEEKFLSGVEDQVRELQIELMRMQCFLEDVDMILDKNRMLRNWIVEIKDLAYKSEIILDTFLFNVRSTRGGRFRRKVRRFVCCFNELLTLHKVGLEIESTKNKLNNLSSRLQIYRTRDVSNISEASSSSRYDKFLMRRRTYADIVENDFIDLPDSTSRLVGDLVCEDKQYRVISICGVGGLGKTTFAKQVYHHKDVRKHFDAFAWACVTQQIKRDDILRGIHKDLMPETEPPREENVLISELLRIQKTKKCLVVLDDMWLIDDWDAMKAAFPNKNDKVGSVIFLTTRNQDVAEYIDHRGSHHTLPLLDEEQSWNLLCKKALITESTITEDQKELGMNMMKHCMGLPLTLVVLGGILARKHTLDEWMAVCKNIDLYLRGDKVFAGQTRGVTEILALSYYDLPYWLKPCFLFLGNYPGDYEILTHTLYQLWIAEGFVSLDEERRGGEETLMTVAECYLSEFAQRSLVQVQISKVEDKDFVYRSFGRFKSCRLHDLVREMCLSMVKDENFLKVIDHRQSNEQRYRSSFSSSSSSCKIHRLAIYGNENIHPSNICIDGKEKIRTVLFFDGNKCSSSCCEEIVSCLPKNFKSARVMHLDNFASYQRGRFELPKAIGDLFHLRYISLQDGMFKLPSSIGNLMNLQTLDLSSFLSIAVPNILWQLKQLMHLYLPSSCELVECHKLRLDGLENLELLHNFNSKFCIVEDLQKLINLRWLTSVKISKNRRDLVVFVSYLMSISQKQLLLQYSCLRISEIDFCTKDDVALLKQMFFECHSLHYLTIIGRISELPEYQQGLHSSLTHLCLFNAKLEEDPMARLGKLTNLSRLHLSNAYLGKEMVSSVRSFPLLKKLALERLQQLEDWRVDEEAMPNLSCLEISDSVKLKMLPNGLRRITTLQELYIEYMPQAFMNRLKLPDGTAGMDFDKVSHIPYIQIRFAKPDRDNNEEYQVITESLVQ